MAASRLKRPEGTAVGEDDVVSLPPRERHIKELAQKLSAPPSPSEEKPARALEMSGIVSKAKEELAKSQSRGEMVAIICLTIYKIITLL